MKKRGPINNLAAGLKTGVGTTEPADEKPIQETNDTPPEKIPEPPKEAEAVGVPVAEASTSHYNPLGIDLNPPRMGGGNSTVDLSVNEEPEPKIMVGLRVSSTTMDRLYKLNKRLPSLKMDSPNNYLDPPSQFHKYYEIVGLMYEILKDLTAEKAFQCDLCEKRLVNYSGYLIHRKSKHPHAKPVTNHPYIYEGAEETY